MNTLKEYNIDFKGLKDGIHQFNYQLKQSFFNAIEESTIKDGDFEVNVTLIKKTQLLQFDFSIEGNVVTQCDNCLSDLKVAVSYNGTVYIKFGQEYDEPSDEIIILPHEENSFNIGHLIYEFIVVSMPLRKVHSNKGKDKCDQEMLKRLKSFKPGHSNDNKSEDGNIDPRWDALKNLKDNSN